MLCEVGLKMKQGCENRQFHYIHGGYEQNYSQVEGQEYDWNTEHSSWNQNETDQNWGFLPFILYRPI